MTRELTLQATIDIHAADGKTPSKPTFSMTAYTGGVVNGYIVDMNGLEYSQMMPVLGDHSNTVESVIGQTVRVVIENGELVASGEITSDTAVANHVLTNARNGFKWKCSIGARVLDAKHVRAGDTIEVNGRTFQGPVIVSTKTQLKEISFTPIGADANAAVEVNAKENNNMNEIEKAVSAERQRVQDIEAMCNKIGDVADIRATAIAGEMTVDELSAKLLDVAKSRLEQKAPSGIVRDSAKVDAKTLEAGLLLRFGYEDIAVKTLGEQVVEAGSRFQDAHAMNLCEAAIRSEGKDIPTGGKNEIAASGMSTVAMPTALGNAAKKIALQSYEAAPATYESFAAHVPVSDFNKHDIIRPSFAKPLEELAGGGEIKHDFAEEDAAQIMADTFAKMIAVDRKDLINDSLHLFEQVSRSFGVSARRKQSDLVYNVMLSDDGTFFNTDDGSLMEGLNTILSLESIALAIMKFRSRRDADGNDLDIVPRVLLVPPALETIARQIVDSLAIQYTGGTDGDPVEARAAGNAFKGQLKVEVEQRLSNTTKWDAASDAAWYLLGGPETSAIVTATLNGKRTPQIEYFGINHQINYLSAGWRIYMDFGAALVDPNGVVKMKGSA